VKRILRLKRNGVSIGPKGMFFLALDFESRRLDSGFGYVRLNTLQPQDAAQIPATIESTGNIRGVILDLRGIPGERLKECARSS
jgi:C-terminal processing protease CtpA/Prc